jgi:hypothetical protein
LPRILIKIWWATGGGARSKGSLPVFDRRTHGNPQGDAHYDAHGDVVEERANGDAYQQAYGYSGGFPPHGNISAGAIKLLSGS